MISQALGAVALAVSCLVSISTAITYSPVQPPSYPLAVRSPYLSGVSWIPGSEAVSLPRNSAQFWAGNTLTWSVIARVDGTSYNLFGVANPLGGTTAATVTEATYTSTHSTFLVTAGSRRFTLDFFSPVSPKNYLRQSLPFSYLTVTLAAGNSSSVQIYSDIDSTWTGQTSDSTWSHTTSGAASVFQIVGTSVSTQSGPISTVRKRFVNNGTLSNTYADWTAGGVVAFSHNLGTTADETAVTFAIGHVREESINYLGAAQTGYYRATYKDTPAAVAYFLEDYEDANAESSKLDDLVQSTGASSYGSNYSDILALSVRQTYGGIEITIPNESLDTSDTRAFIKEISSDGNINTVDVIYATFPIFYILSPEYLKLLLSPIFDYMATSAYTKNYAVHEIGANYPNATGHPADGEEMPIEESGNVIFLAYAYQKATGNTDFATTYAAQLKKYATYLQENGLYPATQLSLNDALGALANQTNLAIKAAVGLATYGALTGDTSYTTYGITPWFLVYNHYPDLLFGLNAFPEEAYNATTDFYPTVRQTAGVPLDGSLGWGQTNWQSFAAATVSGDARDIFISDLHAYMSNGLNSAPFSDRYWVEASGSYSAGESYSFRARPTLGSHFALAALSGANTWSY
ncbi:uncharacterized protein N7477_006160 [Penicillium maclennaniae]|uniref:uncharacterized protein n=1 Tax=Penicillium maclennaniae TaxID=1343394 RepID=UPI00253FA938|nr:uncharacterized protein N7477_006160 [Penicillium maclennaniae]KAJ5670797.1 hypothetical protein N7477_006160 [Penicillium maclennaniae]